MLQKRKKSRPCSKTDRGGRPWAHTGANRATVRRAGIDSTPAHARTALSEALTELRRLTRDPLSDGVEQALANLVGAPIRSDFGVDTVRRLRQWSAEHQRVAIELEAAARCCRLVEREINQRVDALLDESPARTRRQLKQIFRRGRPGSRPAGDAPERVWPEPFAPKPLIPEPLVPHQAEPGPMPEPGSMLSLVRCRCRCRRRPKPT